MVANKPEREKERTAVADCNAWNPGLESELPREFLPLATVFRPENVATSLAKAHELADYCGLPPHELVAFRPERLIVHELLVRMTASLAVPDGTDYEDLGRNFRDIASTILNRYVAPHRDKVVRAYEQMKALAARKIAYEIAMHFSPPPQTPSGRPQKPGLLARLGVVSRPAEPPAPVEPPEAREPRTIAAWEEKAASTEGTLDRACFHALARVATAIVSRRGSLLGSRELLAEIAVTLVVNEHGSDEIGDAIELFIQEAVLREGYRALSAHDKPVVMNVKGASASGKSSMRPLQRVLARKLGFPWEDFALISPDIWRKFLLDYGSLGKAYKYAGTMTGHELEIVDQKLDRHMALKAAKGETSHLLIDRFRFDSFVPPSQGKEGMRLLTRFGDLVYMFFMITPPEATVERAWIRGLKVGRYKAVEDLLAHNVEAYTGMPELFFTWALDPGRQVHYEFLDNSVPEGEPPKTVAYGWNGDMTVLDVKRMVDIDRFRKINIRARSATEVYAGKDLAPERNVEFIKRCARMLPNINFADQETGRVYARLERGRWAWRDEEVFARVTADPDARAGLAAVTEAGDTVAGASARRVDLAADKLHTLGAWGDDASPAE